MTGRPGRRGRLGAFLSVAALFLAGVAALDAASARSTGLSLDVVAQTGGAIRSAAAIDGTAWIGEGTGVTRLDISDPDVTRYEGHFTIDPRGEVWCVTWLGRHLFVGGNLGVYVVDVQNPGAPRVLDFMPTSGTVRAITAVTSGDSAATWLFVVDPSTDVAIVEVTPDGRIRPHVSVAGTQGATAPAAVDGRWAVLAGNGVHILDIARLSRPVEVAHVSTAGQVRGLAARDGLAYVADSVEGLIVLPITDPRQPLSRLGGVDAGRLYFYDRYLVMLEQHAVGPNTVRLIDVVDPSQPVDALGGESTYEVLRGAVDLAPVGARFVTARGVSLTVADVSSVFWPQVLPGAEYRSVWPVLSLADANGCVYVAKGSTGLDVVDTSRPPGIAVALSWSPPGGTYGVLVYEGHAYLSTTDGVARFDVRQPCDPIPRGIPLPGWFATRWMAADIGRLVATSQQELAVANLPSIGEPTEIRRLAYADMPGWPAGAMAQGIALYDVGAAYVAAGQAGLGVINLVVPAAISVVRMEQVPQGQPVQSVAVEGQLLAVGTSAGLVLYDLHDPLAPRFVGASPGDESLLSVTFAGQYVFAAADLAGLLAYDVSDPTQPSLVGTFHPAYPVTGVTTGARHVYAAAAGLQVLDPRPGSTRPSPTPPTPTPLPCVPTATPTPDPTATPSPHATVTPTPSPTISPAPSVPTPVWLTRGFLPIVGR